MPVDDLKSIEGMSTSKLSSDVRLYRMWACPLHPSCFTADHVTIDTIKAVADKCPAKCTCWRHAVLRVAARRGELSRRG
jgi:hypothetical protein